MSELTLHNIYIEYDKTPVVHDVNIQLKDGEIGCLLGPSGCGKTTLLRAIAGFEPVAKGEVRLHNQVISSADTHLAPEQRNIGMVFQDYALFPHLNITDNITFGIRKQSSAAKKQRVKELLELVNLPGYEKRYPHELSGGQQQRIALARALAPRPRLLLLDEPFGSQDIELREMLAREVRDILKREGMTAILVTHDQQEAFVMADNIGVLQEGKLQQWGSGYELYYQPDNQFVAGFIGQSSSIQGKVIDHNTISTQLGNIHSEQLPSGCKTACSVDILIRPQAIQLAAQHAKHSARVVSRVFRGSQYLYTLALADNNHIMALTPSHQIHQPGDTVYFELDMQHLVILRQQKTA